MLLHTHFPSLPLYIYRNNKNSIKQLPQDLCKAENYRKERKYYPLWRLKQFASHDVSNSTTFPLRTRMFSKVYLICLHRLDVPHAFSFSFPWKSVSSSVPSLISSSLIVSCVGTQAICQVVLSFSLWKLFFLCPTTPLRQAGSCL